MTRMLSTKFHTTFSRIWSHDRELKFTTEELRKERQLKIKTYATDKGILSGYTGVPGQKIRGKRPPIDKND